MFALTYGFGLIAMDALVNPDVLIVAPAGFDDVVELYTARRPLCECRGDTQSNKHANCEKCQSQTLHTKPPSPRSSNLL